MIKFTRVDIWKAEGIMATMRTRWVTGVIILICSFLNTSCGGGAKINKLDGDSVVVAFGDSLTFGYGADQDSSYPVVLESLLGCRVINSGVPGEESSEGLRRLSGVLEKHKPDLVILCSGGNDMLQKKSKAEIKRNLDSMIQMIEAAKSEVVMLAVPAPGIMLRVPALYKELVREYALPYEADILADVLSSSSLKSDLVHPNEEGYRQIAEAIFLLLEKSQKKE